jgi:hypothetical protein
MTTAATKNLMRDVDTQTTMTATDYIQTLPAVANGLSLAALAWIACDDISNRNCYLKVVNIFQFLTI